MISLLRDAATTLPTALAVKDGSRGIYPTGLRRSRIHFASRHRTTARRRAELGLGHGQRVRALVSSRR
jgi:hypothetical protein